MVIKRTSIFSTVELILLIVLLMAMILFPTFTITNLTVIFSILLIVKGLFSFIDGLVSLGFIQGAFWELIYGAISLILGFIILWDPTIAARTLTYILASWILISGISNIFEGLAIRRTYAGELILLFGGVFSVLLAIFLFIFPWTDIQPFIWFISIYLVLHIIFSWAQMERITVYELREGEPK